MKTFLGILLIISFTDVQAADLRSGGIFEGDGYLTYEFSDGTTRRVHGEVDIKLNRPGAYDFRIVGAGFGVHRLFKPKRDSDGCLRLYESLGKVVGRVCSDKLSLGSWLIKSMNHCHVQLQFEFTTTEHVMRGDYLARKRYCIDR